MIINGAGTTQKQSDWTIQGLFNEYFVEGTLSRRKTNKLTSTVSDPFTFFTISPDLIPEDLKEYADLIIEW